MANRTFRLIARIGSLVPLLWFGGAQADIYIVAHPSVRLTADEAREVFLGGKQLAGSVRLVPFDNAAARGEFLSRVYQMDAAKYETLWAKKAFREGVNAPALKAGDLDVTASVRSTPGGIGYVTTRPADGTNVIAKF